MAKADEEELPDLYELFDVPSDATEDLIKRAFRKQALKYHPDKNPSESAAKRFHHLSVALDLLTDVSRRASYDAQRQAKVDVAARREKMESERRSWIDALEKSEAEAQIGERKRKREATREEQLAQEGARMRADLKRQMQAAAAAHTSASTSTSTSKSTAHAAGTAGASRSNFPNKDTSTGKYAGSSDVNGSNGHGYTVLARFRGRATSAGDLKTLFSQYGKVTEVIYRPSSTNKTQSALIEFADRHAAQAAASSASIESLSKSSGLEFRQITLSEPTSAQPDKHEPSNVSKSKDEGQAKILKTRTVESLDTPVIGSSYESSILEKMRQRQREKMARQAAVDAPTQQ